MEEKKVRYYEIRIRRLRNLLSNDLTKLQRKSVEWELRSAISKLPKQKMPYAGMGHV